jgi:hypothetical protein
MKYTGWCQNDFNVHGYEGVEAAVLGLAVPERPCAGPGEPTDPARQPANPALDVSVPRRPGPSAAVFAPLSAPRARNKRAAQTRSTVEDAKGARPGGAGPDSCCRPRCCRPPGSRSSPASSRRRWSPCRSTPGTAAPRRRAGTCRSGCAAGRGRASPSINAGTRHSSEPLQDIGHLCGLGTHLVGSAWSAPAQLTAQPTQADGPSAPGCAAAQVPCRVHSSALWQRGRRQLGPTAANWPVHSGGNTAINPAGAQQAVNGLKLA